jgi:hypothetical protein
MKNGIDHTTNPTKGKERMREKSLSVTIMFYKANFLNQLEQEIIRSKFNLKHKKGNEQSTNQSSSGSILPLNLTNRYRGHTHEQF